jgi:hypothetical protein
VLSAKARFKKVITGSDALAEPAGQAALCQPAKPQDLEARQLLAQCTKKKQVSCSGGAAK